MDLDKIHNVYFVGIGGIGMSALARYFKLIGKRVYGYDLVSTELTSQLKNEGIDLVFDGSETMIPDECKDLQTTLVVFTPAIPESLPILKWFRDKGFRVYKRSRVLGLLTKAKQGVCVAGTHGKTTVSTMIGHLLTQSGIGCSAFLGGISKNYNSNLLVSSKSDYVVVEADEFDRSFHQLSPDVALITSVDADHLDIYGTKEALKEAFQIFTSLISPEGILMLKHGIDFSPRIKKDVTIYEYGFDANADFYAKNIRLIEGLYHFDLVTPKETISDLKLGIPGRVNLENAIGACSVAWLLGVKKDEMRLSLQSFLGIKRRFEYQITGNPCVYIDDYAHHPEEIKAALSSARELYPDMKLSVVFQPHLFSRTQDFAAGFAASLDMADEVVLLDIYPARELPMKGVTSSIIYEKIMLTEKYLISKHDLYSFLRGKKFEVLLTLGAGDIGMMTSKIKEILLDK